MVSDELMLKVEDVLHAGMAEHETIQELCALLKHEVAHYDWVGIYVADTAARTLHLGPYSGAPTNHTRIPFGQGVCGQTAERGETMVVQDVSQEQNYLSCSLHVQSEIVVPVFHHNRVVGQIDIDSHQHSPFTQHDRIWLEKLATRIAPIIARLQEAAANAAETA
ncbi:GAF domain-containing protein [Spirochaeta africana]|uniref:GAF domain-containing protein n=1 Tax=Spirochaeta africana (strain ATCC 700263 / DSM 8902 / Z-7692) TaxID=889378 RepID=H9UJT7_SPIAZ|nr:GAF domain-containing protein [Spirochaeta africana]AFG37780.1 GAF domain-containing protein [Spirochaeta africana DSM 8902]